MRMISSEDISAIHDTEDFAFDNKSINNVLPPEVLSMILEMASKSSKQLMSIVGSFVCSLWRQILLPHRPRGGRYRDYKFTTLLAKQGWLSLLQWARQKGCKWDAATCSAAAGAGHLEILKWARANGCIWNTDTCSAAAGAGHLDVLKWAREAGCDWSTDYTLAARRTW